MARKPKQQTDTSRRGYLKLAGTAGIAGLAGCGGVGGGGGNGNSSGTTEVEFWTLFAGGDGKTMKSLVDKFNEEHDDIQVKRERQPFAEYYDKLFTSMTGGSSPDLAVFHTSELERFVDAIQPLDDKISSGTSDAYVSSIWDEVKYGGNHVALPLDTHPNGLYYNKDIFEEAGLDPESPPSNFEELKTAANTIAAETDKIAFNPEPYQGFYVRQFIAWLEGRGGQFLNDDKTKAQFAGPEGQAIAEFYSNITGGWGWDKADSTENRGTKAFRSGDMAMTVNGTWYYGVLAEKDFEWGMTKPFVAPGQSANMTWANSHTIGLPRKKNQSDSKRQAAITVAEWLTQNATEWGTSAGHLPAAESVLQADELRSANVWKKTLSTYKEMADAGQLAYMPSTSNNGNYKRPVNEALGQIYSQKKEPVSAIETAANDVNSNL
ncbi:MAG: ABC transporter substrate-binding protein [Halapricum sp.]